MLEGSTKERFLLSASVPLMEQKRSVQKMEHVLPSFHNGSGPLVWNTVVPLKDGTHVRFVPRWIGSCVCASVSLKDVLLDEKKTLFLLRSAYYDRQPVPHSVVFSSPFHQR